MLEEAPNVLDLHPNVLRVALPSCTAVDVFQVNAVIMTHVRFRLQQ